MKKAIIGICAMGLILVSTTNVWASWFSEAYCSATESCKDEPATRVIAIGLRTDKDTSPWNATVRHRAFYDNGTWSSLRDIWKNRDGAQMIMLQPKRLVYFVPFYSVVVSRNGDTPLYSSTWQAPWANYDILRETESLDPNQFSVDGARYCTMQARLKIGHNSGNTSLYNYLYYTVGSVKMKRIFVWYNGGWVRTDREVYMIP